MLKVLIIDDEKFARVALRAILETHFKEKFQILGEASDVPEAVRLIHATKPDLIFIDIQMPEYSGFDLLSFFDPSQIFFHIVFVTAFNEFALKAFEISAVDYLLKPVHKDQIQRVLDKLNKSVPNEILYKNLNDNLQNPKTPKLLLQSVENIFIVKLEEIQYLEADGSYTRFILADTSEIIISKGLIEFEFIEKYDFFFRAHRSYIVNLNAIKRILKKDNLIEMQNGKTLPITLEKKKRLIDYWS